MRKILSKCYHKIKFIFSKNNNRIFSYDVHFNAIAGVGVEVREGTLIDSSSVIGSYTYVGRNCAITKSSIGRYCSIANNVSIGQGEHKLDHISTISIFYTNTYSTLTEKDCCIGDDVWIGVDAIILRGVSIGIGAVIGANSVVTKDVLPFAIVVGSLARVIRYRFDKDKIKSILASKWWLKTPNEAKFTFCTLNVNDSLAIDKVKNR